MPEMPDAGEDHGQSMFIRGGDANYFGRLFRNVTVDATLFTLLAAGGAHGA